MELKVYWDVDGSTVCLAKSHKGNGHISIVYPAQFILRTRAGDRLDTRSVSLQHLPLGIMQLSAERLVAWDGATADSSANGATLGKSWPTKVWCDSKSGSKFMTWLIPSDKKQEYSE